MINDAIDMGVQNRMLSQSEIQSRLFEMLVKFDTFCSQNGLRYYLADGTLLGAVRHDGFIPWDDDLDVLMPREDYERLIEFSEIDDELDVVSYQNSKSYYHPYIYCNLADKKTKIVEANAKKPTGKGLFIDVFPLDGVPSNSVIRRLFIDRVYLFRTFVNYSNRKYTSDKSMKGLLKNLFVFFSSSIDIEKALKKLDHLMQKYPFQSCELCTELIDGKPNGNLWKKQDFDKVVLHKFNGKEFPIPAGYDRILTVTYGDYMTLPPEEDRIGHHGIDVFERAPLEVGASRAE